MKNFSLKTLLLAILPLLFSHCNENDGTSQNKANITQCYSYGTRMLGTEGLVSVKMLLEESNLGSDEVEVGELILVPQPNGEKIPPHAHGSLEVFYIVTGAMEFSVDDEPPVILRPGGIGIVRKGQQVNHNIASEEPLKALIIWVPGGEANRVIKRTKLPVRDLNL